jgi:hypothetical protein
MQLPESWRELSPEENTRFTHELRKEVSDDHVLAKLSVEAVARRRTDDFLFCGDAGEPRCFIVHLTWRKETLSDFPWTTEFESMEDFQANWKRHFD